jgi:3-dehydroquinate synthase
MPDPVIVRHALGSYPVYVEPGVLARLDGLARDHLADRRVALIADAAVRELYQAERWGPVTWTGETLTVPPGEKSKSRESWSRLTDDLLDRQFGRDSGLIGLGGGMVGDLTGFVAATYMRGIPYILVPTTLLAMVDASVGGKTGVNTSKGKNLVGAFHPPSAVLADPLVLGTLPDREYRGGLAEAVKHGLIADPGYFDWMETQATAIIRRDPPTVARLVLRSVEIKAEVVGEDEREAGRRAILNAGHTVAHALEQTSDYQLPHGEAVALGLVAECEIAERLGIASTGLRSRVAALLDRLGLAVHLPGPLNRGEVLGRMGIDKKNRSAMIHFALAKQIGQMHHDAGWTAAVTVPHIEAALVALE